MTPPHPTPPRPADRAPVAPAEGGAGAEAALRRLRALPDPAHAPDPAAALVEDARELDEVHDALRSRLDATAS